MESNRKSSVASITSWYFAFMLLLSTITVAGQVVVGGQDISASAMLEIKGTNDGGLTYKGLMPPRVPTIAARDAIVSSDSDKGMLIFVSEIGCLQIFNGLSWESINCLTTTINSSVQYTTTILSVNEGDGGIDLPITISNPSGVSDIIVTITPNSYDEIDETAPQTITIPFGQTSYTAANIFTLTDDTDIEGLHQVIFTITSVSGGNGTATVGAANFLLLNITDND